MNILLQNKLKFLLICLLGIFGFWFQVQAQIVENPAVYVTKLEVKKTLESEIEGNFDVWNSENYYLADLNYIIQLFRETDFYQLKLVDEELIKERFFIPPNTKIFKSFSYKYPQNIISGNYTLRIRIITEKGVALGWQDKTIFLEGKNIFLDIDPYSASVFYEGSEFLPLEGVKVSPEKEVEVKFLVKNLGEEITATSKIKIFQRQITWPIVKEYEEGPITFTRGGLKEVKFKMPKFNFPESYLAQVRFYKGEEPLSGFQYFRWVIKGEGGKVLLIKSDKDYYQKGEVAKIRVDTVGPADLSDIGRGKLVVLIYDKEGNIAGEAYQEVPLNPTLTSSEVKISVEKDLISPQIEAKLIKDGNILDSHHIQLPIFSKEAKKEAVKQEEVKQLEKGEETKEYLSYLIIVLVLIGGFLIYKLKIKKRK